MKRPTYESALFLLALLLALSVRFYNLGAAPLSDAEASHALQALHIADSGFDPGAPLTSPKPAYTMLTGALFALAGSSNFAARFWPALCGSVLVLLPYFFRRELGSTAAVIMAFGLAIDPGLVSTARTVGSPALALGFAALAAGLWRQRRYPLAGALGGLALLCGSPALQGALVLGLGWGVVAYARRTRQIEKHDFQETGEEPGDPPEIPQPQQKAALRQAWRGALLVGALTFLAVGTLFFLRPAGLAGWFQSLLAWLEGWRTPAAIPPGRILAALLVYQPFALLFALIGLGRWLFEAAKAEDGELIDGNRAAGGASSLQPNLLPMLWVIFGLAIILFYPGRQVADLIWILPPLWALAALELGRYSAGDRLHTMSLVHACLLMILGGLLWNMLQAPETLVATTLPWALVRGFLVLAVLALAVLTTVLVGLGWSSEVSRLGLVWGVSGIFCIYLASAMWGSAHLRQNQAAELWRTPPGTLQAELLHDTLLQLAEWRGKFPASLEVTSTVTAPSMRWLLRDFTQAQFASELATGNLPAVIITTQEEEAPALTASYRGQDFTWWSYPAWAGALPPEALAWLTGRKAPQVEAQVILWARGDLFPGGGSDASVAP